MTPTPHHQQASTTMSISPNSTAESAEEAFSYFLVFVGVKYEHFVIDWRALFR
jgi:hypothetical protein